MAAMNKIGRKSRDDGVDITRAISGKRVTKTTDSDSLKANVNKLNPNSQKVLFDVNNCNNSFKTCEYHYANFLVTISQVARTNFLKLI